eukprot:1577908-Pyramimonas_sp.AAC.1
MTRSPTQRSAFQARRMGVRAEKSHGVEQNSHVAGGPLGGPRDRGAPILDHRRDRHADAAPEMLRGT